MKRNATVREATRDRQPLGALSARLCLERSFGVSLLLVLRPPLVAPYCDVIWHVTRGRAHARLPARRVSRERSAAPHRALYTLYTHLVHALCAPVIFINRRVTTTTTTTTTTSTTIAATTTTSGRHDFFVTPTDIAWEDLTIRQEATRSWLSRIGREGGRKGGRGEKEEKEGVRERG